MKLCLAFAHLEGNLHNRIQSFDFLCAVIASGVKANPIPARAKNLAFWKQLIAAAVFVCVRGV